MKKFFTLFLFVSLFALNVFSQWTNDPVGNNVICDTTGESALSKVVSTADGGNFVSWFDNRGGSYAVYLQRLNEFGNKVWANNGLLVSANPQNSSLVDYDLAVDNQGNAIVAFTDVRNGSLNVYAYKISPAGNFLWGNNGVSLSATTEYQPNPKIAITNDGNVVVAWIIAVNPYKIALQKLSPDGTKLWGTNPIIYQSSSGEGYNYPKPIASDSGSVILIHTLTTGNFPAQVVKIAAQKISADGTAKWGTGGVWIQNIGRVQNFSAPFSSSDNVNGAFISWYDDRDNNNLQSSFVQRINSVGSPYYPANGTEVCLTANEHKFYPVTSHLNSLNEVFVFWIEKNSLQSQAAIIGQKISSSGNRLWSDNGIVLLSFTSNAISGLTSAAIDSSVYLFYNEGNTSGVQNKIMAMNISRTGNNIWNNPVTLSNPTQEKLHVVSTRDIYKVGKVFWTDRRNDAGGIYAQNVNPNGSLGNLIVPVELSAFTANVSGNNVLLNWSTASETNNSGFEVQRIAFSNRHSDWEAVGFIEANGTTTEKQNYSFVDNNLSAGKYIYRLKQIDFGGAYEYSNTTEVDVTLPNEFKLYQNYPNPFNPSTVISYQLSASSNISLKIYDVLGNKIATLIDNEWREAGYHNYQLFPDASGLNYQLTTGVYFYRLQAGAFTATKKFVLMK